MVTKSTGEAMALLEATRKKFIQEARQVALGLIGKHGSTHTREVRAEMKAQGLLGDEQQAEYWLGSVFRGPLFKWTGDWYVYTDPDRNIHERRIKTWTWTLIE